jgi:hypothetical protein
MDPYYTNMIKEYIESRKNLEFPDNDRLNLFKSLGPLTRDLMITTYGSFEGFINAANNPHPFEEYYISFDEFMFEDDIIVSIARRMGIYIGMRMDAYKIFINRVVELIKKSKFTYDEYNKYINMTSSEYNKLNLDGLYDDRLLVFMSLQN